jgi:hypothetical protein
MSTSLYSGAIQVDTTLFNCDPTTMPNDPSQAQPVTTNLGTFYYYATAGVVLPAHTHNDSNIHATMVLTGSISVVTTANQTPTVYSAPALIDFSVNDGHVITAASDKTLCFNIVKLGTNISTIASGLQTLITTAESLASNISALANSNTGTNPLT